MSDNKDSKLEQQLRRVKLLMAEIIITFDDERIRRNNEEKLARAELRKKLATRSI